MAIPVQVPFINVHQKPKSLQIKQSACYNPAMELLPAVIIALFLRKIGTRLAQSAFLFRVAP